MNGWETVLLVLGGLAAIPVLAWLMVKLMLRPHPRRETGKRGRWDLF